MTGQSSGAPDRGLVGSRVRVEEPGGRARREQHPRGGEVPCRVSHEQITEVDDARERFAKGE